MNLSYLLRFWKGRGISIIIPFRCPVSTDRRTQNLKWLVEYWKHQLPGADIILGEDPSFKHPFSKSVAVNNAATVAKGDILVVIDADGFIAPEAVLKCATEIRHARNVGKRLWFIPYRKFYRLNEAASNILLHSNPNRPHIFPSPPGDAHIQGDADPNVGHWYGAMVQIMPREAFDAVGGWDPRFRGWGGEDHAAMRAMDTLYWPHKTLPTQVLHMWHPQLGPNGSNEWVHWKERMWEGQVDPAVNDRLSWRYYHATGNPPLMRRLVDEGFRFPIAERLAWLQECARESREAERRGRHHHRRHKHRLSC